MVLRICLMALMAGHCTTCLGAYAFRELYRFTNSLPGPSGLAWGNDGLLYGSCWQSGDYNKGYVFSVTTNGLLTTLATFAGTNGANPSGKLVLGKDGAFYGTTERGGPADSGTIFRVSTNGALEMLAAFTGAVGPNFGQEPSGLCLGRDGAFYGCSMFASGGSNTGTAYRITTNGIFTSLVTFGGGQAGYLPNGTLVEGPDGAFYGTTPTGGPGSYGAIFRVTSDGALSLVAAFNGTNGAQPLAPLTLGMDGVLYGTTYSGAHGYNGIYIGNVFRCTIGGELSTLHDFVGGPTGYYPEAQLVQGTNGLLYGTTSSTASAQTSGTLFSITTNGDWTNLIIFGITNGNAYTESPVLAPDGSFYGTVTRAGPAMAGMVFKFIPGQDLIPVAFFRAAIKGTSPSSLVQTSEGLLYGTTSGGGSNSVGTAFCMDTNGYMFFSASLDPAIAAGPASPLIKGPDGAVYGLAEKGGAYGYGSIYRVTTNGELAGFASFNQTNGANPMGQFYIDAAGRIFGLTYNGGVFDQGAFFCADTNGSISVLASFSTNAPLYSGLPKYGLTHGSDGAFYGTSSSPGSGSLFKVTTNGMITVLTFFDSQTGVAEGVPMQAPNGLFYGTSRASFYRFTTNGAFTFISMFFSTHWPPSVTIGPDGFFYGMIAPPGDGTLYRFTTNGTRTTIMTFNSSTTGAIPTGGLILGQDNKFYGSTTTGAGFGGNVFSLETTSVLRTPRFVNGHVSLSFSGMPNVSYRLQRSPCPTGPWINLGLAVPNANGEGGISDLTNPPTNAVYRLVEQ